MTERKSLSVLEEKASKIAGQMEKIKPKVDKARELANKWATRAVTLAQQYHTLSEKIAGLNGHLAMREFGAAQYEIIKDGQWSTIKFYNDQGEEVRNPNWPKTL